MTLYIQTNPDHEGPLGARRVEQLITMARPAQARQRNVMFFTDYVAMVWSWTFSTVRMQTTCNVSLPSLSDTEEKGA